MIIDGPSFLKMLFVKGIIKQKRACRKSGKAPGILDKAGRKTYNLFVNL